MGEGGVTQALLETQPPIVQLRGIIYNKNIYFLKKIEGPLSLICHLVELLCFFGGHDISITVEEKYWWNLHFFFSFEANHPHALLKIHKKYPITGILIKQPPQMPQNSPRWQMKDNGHIYLFQEKYIFLTDPV